MSQECYYEISIGRLALVINRCRRNSPKAHLVRCNLQQPLHCSSKRLLVGNQRVRGLAEENMACNIQLVTIDQVPHIDRLAKLNLLQYMCEMTFRDFEIV